jgi:putative membrane protein
MKILHDAWAIARAELGLIQRFPRLLVALVGVLLIPSLYALIYLSSVWDPAAKTTALSAAIVNLDEGIDYKGTQAHVGADLVASIKAKPVFAFQTYADEGEARQAVREGRVTLALIIPRDFSANAVPGMKAGGGKLIVYISEGNNYSSAGMARRFAGELGHQVNETLNEKRWALVLNASAGSQSSVRKLKDGVAQLRQASHDLAKGMTQADEGAAKLQGGAQGLADAAQQLTGGVKQLGGGLRTMDAQRPAAADLQALKSGSKTLVEGHAALGRGLEQLQGGAARLTEGSKQLRDETEDIPFVGGKVSAGAGALMEGGEQLVGGLQQARSAQQQLGDGAAKLQGGVGKLADGVGAFGEGLHTLALRVPPDAKLNEFAAGAGTLAQGAAGLKGGTVKLSSGAAQLAGGMDLLAASLPADIPSLGGSSRGLAESVLPVVEVAAPVPNNGSGFAPNFMSVALWLGAVMTTFLFHIRRLPQCGEGAARVSLMLGKLGMLVPIVFTQALCVMVVMVGVLAVPVQHVLLLGLTTALASLTFLLIIVALVRMFGDAGKGVALLLLVLQLSASGGVMPVELTGDVFQALNPWLPFTWVVRAFRASMFGAFDNAWLHAWAVVGLIAGVALVLATFVGRWRFVSGDEHRPAFDV